MTDWNRRLSLRGALVIMFLVVVLVFAALLSSDGQDVQSLLGAGRLKGTVGHQLDTARDDHPSHVGILDILFEKGIYKNGSFANEAGIVPAFWNETGMVSQNSKISTTTFGPCYLRKEPVDWEAAIAKYNRSGQPKYNTQLVTLQNEMDLGGYCRPGFLIIGAGKCGTSSLYHYISSHPKVLPAYQKQIHYFKYHKQEPLKWYYQFFPKTESFLASGALLSGEASPGYLPYPDVVIEMKQSMPEPKLLAVGRHPIERAYSSYNYNYVDPHVKLLRKGRIKGVEKGMPDSFYMQYLFTFEEMVRAELPVLRECFALGSKAQDETRKRWGKVGWVKNELTRRENEGMAPLIDLDGYCYGGETTTALRRQWVDLMAAHPEKVILNRNTHLTQAIIGRSLYLFPLEWWYAAFSKEHVYFVCTEELEDFTGNSMNSVGQFLGLPRYENFSSVVQSGAYNVGGHKGYDTEITWTEVREEHRKEAIPLSEDFRRELEDFIRPYNERLFDLTGRRCHW